jgi:UDP:flavonoid glycosyltransferase YjiC (YdhE family)
MRRIALALVGSRGDVQPGLAVALELRRRGHRVALGVAPNMLGMARHLGLEAVAIGVDSREFLRSPLIRHDMHSPDPRRRVLALREVASHGWTELRDGLMTLSEQADLVVTGLLGQEMGFAVAEARGIAFGALHYSPVRANSVVPIVPFATQRRTVQRAAWYVGEGLRWTLSRRAENAHRAELGLPRAVVDLPRRLRDRGATEVQAYDAALVPGLAAEWGVRRPIVGSLDLDGALHDRLPEDAAGEDLAAWLDEGDAPIYVGFGSMPVAHPDALLAIVEHMCEALGVRALVAAGWSEIQPRCDARIRVVGSVDHARVLPRCAVAVHHGGAGTTAAVVRAGIPSVICAFSGDQGMWASVLRDHQVGTSVRFARLTPASLVNAVLAVSEPAVRARAGRLAARMTSARQAVSAAADRLEAAV